MAIAWIIRNGPTLLVLGAITSGSLWFMGVLRDREALEAQNAALTRSMAALERQAAQARLAADVARAEAERFAAKAQEYDALREALIKGEQDAPLPDWFRDYLDQLLGGLPVAD